MPARSVPGVLRAGVTYFALVFAAGAILGTGRVLWLVPRLGARTAELLEMPVMLAVIVLAARFVTRRFALPRGTAPRLGAGALALALLVAAELLLAVVLSGRSLAGYLAARDPVSGSVYLGLLGLFALLPWLLAWDPRGR